MSEPVDDPELRALFVDEMRRHAGRFAQAGTDVALRARSLHSMRGAAAMMGLADVAALLGELEAGTRAGDVDAAARGFGRLCALLRAAGLPTDAIEAAASSAGGMLVGEDWASDAPRASMSSPPRGERPSLDPEVLAYFYADARARIERIGEELGALSRSGAREALDEALRQAHALKGAAATVGLATIARGAHALEGAISSIKTRAREPTATEVDTLASARARLASALSNPDGAGAEIEAMVVALRAAGLVREHDLGPLGLGRDRVRASPVLDVIRVPTSAVAGLAESVGEVGFIRDRLEQHAAVVASVGRMLVDAARAVDEELRRIGPPRPWGAPADALDRLDALARTLEHAGAETGAESERIAHDAEVLGALASTARESLRHLGASSVRWLFERVVPAADAVGRRESKDILVVREGEDVEIERRLAERLVEPLSQLVRNAVTHGIEQPAVRVARGKPARATLRLSAAVAGDRLRIAVEDDGAGVDVEAVRRRALESGALDPADASDEGAVLAAVFRPGVSTRGLADAAAGRGVGLELVHREVSQLGGTVSLSSQRGAYTRFEVTIPLRALVQRALVVLAAGERVALPLDRVLRVARSPEDASDARLISLAEALGAVPAPRDDRRGPIVLVSTAAGLLGAYVEAVERAREFVVRPLPPLLDGLRPFGAATVDGEGHVMLVIDVDLLA